MKKHCIYYSSRPVNPFVLVIMALLVIMAFFITLPIFLAALTVFAGTAIYMTWKVKRALKETVRQMEMEEEQCTLNSSGMIIDITEDKENHTPS